MSYPLLKQAGISYLGKDNTRYWRFCINPHFYGLTRHLRGTITHCTNSDKKFHVHIEQTNSTGFKELHTDIFREAFNFLALHVVKPMFKYDNTNAHTKTVTS